MGGPVFDEGRLALDRVTLSGNVAQGGSGAGGARSFSDATRRMTYQPSPVGRSGQGASVML